MGGEVKSAGGGVGVGGVRVDLYREGGLRTRGAMWASAGCVVRVGWGVREGLTG